MKHTRILLTALALTLPLAGAKAQCTNRPAGLVGWWPGDGHYADLVGGHSGTPSGGVSFAPGRVGQALQFNGVDGLVSLGTGPDLVGTGPFSIQAWIQTTRAADEYIIAQRDRDSVNGEYTLNLIGGQVRFATYADAHGYGLEFLSSRTVHDGTFHHIVAVREADGTGRIYIDGQLDASQSAPPTPLAVNPIEVHIGCDWRDLPLGYGRFFQGLIDELSLFNRALSAGEVAALDAAGSMGMCKPAFPMPSGLVAWWPGDGHFFDLVGANHGTPSGNVAFTPGEVGQSFAVAGVGRIRFDSKFPFHGAGDATITFWLKAPPPRQSPRHLVDPP